MKYKSLITVFLLLAGISCYGRTFLSGETIYVNVQQNDGLGDWSQAGAHLFLYIWNNSGDAWVALSQYENKLYSGLMPAGDWTNFIVVRKSNTDAVGNWTNVWNQTCDCTFNFDNSANNSDHHNERGFNVIYEFWKKDGNCDNMGYVNWRTYAPKVSAIPAYNTLKNTVTTDNIKICPSALGGPFSLRAKLNSAKTEYVYSNVHQHAWYRSTNGTSWTSVDGYAGVVRDEGEGEIDRIDNVLPASGSTIYYYLYSADPAGRRLLRITTDAPDCALTCAITSFETAVSAVNADDNTYTLDGMVAFGKAEGDLVIECDGKSTTITSPKSPQSFSLNKVPAATSNGVTTTARAYFSGGTGCDKTITINVPNSTQALETVSKSVLTGETALLTPQNADPANDYVWIVDGVEHKKADGQQQNFTTETYNTTTTKTYVYKEYYPVSGTTADMMNNGSYEQTSGYGTFGTVSTISDYNFWGCYQSTSTAQLNFYQNDDVNCPSRDGSNNCVHLTENGFAVVRNANNFFQTFARVLPRDDDAGSNFALFDAATGTAGGNKRAWYTTTQQSPQLKLKQGTTYVFSFWAANINNYGEMDNAAKLQFRIQYKKNGATITKNLGEVLDLGTDEYRNNIWHQRSATYTHTDPNADDVTISVVNLNTNTLNTGNDFALDDIQFHAISSVSRVVKSHQVFTVTFNEPAVNSLTITPRQHDCGATGYTVDLSATFQYPKGNLIIQDVNSGETLLSLTVADNATSATGVITFQDLNTHSLKAYFSQWDYPNKPATYKTADAVPLTTPQITEVTYIDRSTEIVNCNSAVYAQSGTVKYINMNAPFTVTIDGNTALSKQYAIDANQTLEDAKNFAIDNVPADSLEHTAVVTFGGRGANCTEQVTFRAPYSPVITNVQVTDNNINFACGDNGVYHYKVLVYFTNAHATSDLTVQFHDGTIQTKKATASPVEFVYAANGPTDGAQHEVYAWFNYVHPAASHDAVADDCEYPRSFAAPHLPQLNLLSTLYSTPGCNDLTTTLTATLNYTYQQGTLTYWVDNLAHHTASYTAASDDAKTLQLVVSDIPADGKSNHVLHVEFSNTNSCRLEFTLPAVPLSTHIESVVVSDVPNPVACSATDYSATVTVTSTYDLTGQTIVLTRPDGTPVTIAAPASQQGFAASGTTSVIPVTLTDINSGVGTIVAACASTLQCTAQGTYTSPQLAAITPNFSVSTTDNACGVMNYSVSGTINFDIADGDLVVRFDNAHQTTVSVPAGATSASFTIPGMTASAKDLQLMAYFTGNPSCSAMSAPFDAPVLPTLNATMAVDTVLNCNTKSYQVSLTINAEHQTGSMTVTDRNITTGQVTTHSAAAFTIARPTANEEHEIAVAYSGPNDCSYVFPQHIMVSPDVPHITRFDITPVEVDCGTTSYNQPFTLLSHRMQGAPTFILDNTDVTAAVVDNGNGNYVLTGVDTQHTTHRFTVDYGTAMCDSNITFDTPVLPYLAITAPAATAQCDVPTYQQHFNIQYIYQRGVMKLLIDGIENRVLNYAERSNQLVTLPVTVDMPADGQQHTVSVIAGNGCEALNESFTAPQAPVISSLTATEVPVRLACDEISYALTLNITAANYVGQTLVVEYTDAGTQHHQTHSVTSPQMQITLSLFDVNNGTHNVNVYFDGYNCLHSVSYTAPVKATVVSDFAVSVGATECSVMDYSVSGVVSFDVADGDLVVQYDNAHRQVITVPDGATTADFTISHMMSATNAMQLTAYFTGNPQCTALSAAFEAPAMPTLNATMAVDTVLNCNTKSYQVSLTINAEHQTGSMTVTDRNITTGQVTTHSAAAFTIARPTANEEHEIAVAYSGPNDCSYVFPQHIMVSPDVPHITRFDITPVEVDCGTTSYNQPFTLLSHRMQGAPTFILDNTDVTAAVVDNGNGNYVLTGVDTQHTTHRFTVDYGTAMCDSNITFDTPVLPYLAITAPAATAQCDVPTYQQHFNIQYIYQRGVMKLLIDGIENRVLNYAERSNQLVTLPVTVDMPADGQQHTVSVIAGNGCEALNESFTAPQAPVISSLTATEVPVRLACDEISYALTLNITAANYVGQTLVVEYTDAGTQHHQTHSVTSPQMQITLSLFDVNNGTHNVNVYFDGYNCLHSVSYTAPVKATVVSDFAVSVGATECSVMDYSVSGVVSFDVADGDLVVQYDNAHRQVITVPDGATTADFTISHMMSATNAMQLTAYFTGNPQCTALSAAFEAPAMPTLTATMTVDSTVVCDDKTYTVNLNITADNQTGIMTVTDRNITTGAVTTFSTATYDVPRPATNEEHEVTISYDGPHDCSYTLPKHFFTTPDVPHINSVSVTPHDMACGDDKYAVTVTIAFEHQSGTLTVEDNGVVLLTTDQVLTSPYTFTTDKVITTGAATHNIVVNYGLCTTNISAAYQEPVVPECNRYEALLCHGESYDLNGFHLATPDIGEHHIALAVNNPAVITPQNRLDSLILTVKAQPTVTLGELDIYCSDLSNMSLPYSIAQGEPDIFNLTIAGKPVNISATAEELIADMPTDIKSGNYEAVLTVGQTDLQCTTTTTFNVNIADGSLMYSKWNGVLFIDNHENRITAYQWYRDGVAMSGETQQRLYNPDGLQGIYYCAVTDVDGNVIYTCPKAFDDVRRSADEVVERQQQVTVTPTRARAAMPILIAITGNVPDAQLNSATVFDATGKRVAQYQLAGSETNIVAPGQQGMYIIRVNTNGGAVTRKIVVY